MYDWFLLTYVYGYFHGTCDTKYTTFSKSFETFRACVLVTSKTFSLLHKSSTTPCSRAVAQIPNTLWNGFLKYLIHCITPSFALLCAIEILMIDLDSPSAGLSESLFLKKIWTRRWPKGLWKPSSVPKYSRPKNSISRELWSSWHISFDRASKDLSNHMCAVGGEWDFTEIESSENQHRFLKIHNFFFVKMD